jgi:hypothetical protein
MKAVGDPDIRKRGLRSLGTVERYVSYKSFSTYAHGI